ncbi:MAG: bacteriophage holin [Acidobacteriota bacterium]
MQLNKTALGLSAGILWGLAVFVASLWITWRDGGEHLFLLRQFYLGYSVSYAGAVVGLVYGFVHGFVGGWILAWLYNRFAGSKSA